MYGTTLGLLVSGPCPGAACRARRSLNSSSGPSGRRRPRRRPHVVPPPPRVRAKFAVAPRPGAGRRAGRHLACTWRSSETRGAGGGRPGRLRPGRCSSTPPGRDVDQGGARRGLAGAGDAVRLDVYRTSRGGTAALTSRSSPCPVYGTHHIGASTGQAQERSPPRRCGSWTRRPDGPVPNVVNLARGRGDHVLVIRHRDRPGVLAHVFEHLREATSTSRRPRHRVRGRRPRSRGSTSNARLRMRS